MQKLKLVPDINGPVEVLEQFWAEDDKNEELKHTVPPLLAYAELMTSFDSRTGQPRNELKSIFE